MFLQEDSSFFKFRNNQLGFGTLAYSVYIDLINRSGILGHESLMVPGGNIRAEKIMY